MAKYNFSNYLVRNFDIEMDQDDNGLCRMLISGFLNYDEARQYARQLYSVNGQLATMLHACRSLIVSEQNLRLLGTTYSYHDYELFFEKQIAPVEISTRPLLEEPEVIIQEEEEDSKPTSGGQQPRLATTCQTTRYLTRLYSNRTISQTSTTTSGDNNRNIQISK